jgi:hypothetical protein
MKKLILSVAMLAVGSAAFAQKSASGDFTLETTLNLQVGTAPISLFTPNVRARYFIMDDLAARVQFLSSSDNMTNNFNENSDGTGGKGEQIIKNSFFSFGIGAEKHFAGTDKLSPYLGALVTFGSFGASEEWKEFDESTSAYSKGTTGNITNGNTMGGSAASFFNFSLLAGADYYFLENVYIGGEFGWGFTSIGGKDEEKTETKGGTTTKEINPGSSSSGLGISTGSIRLGVKF